MTIFRNIYLHIFCSLLLALFVGIFSYLFASIFSFLRYGVFIFVYLLIGFGIFYFYRLTTIFYRGTTFLSLAVNFILWTIEQVITENRFHYSILYQDEEIARIFVLVYGAFLLSINKLVLDETFKRLKAKTKGKMRIEILLNNYKKKKQEDFT